MVSEYFFIKKFNFMSSYFVEFTSSGKSVELHWTEPGGRSDFKSLLIDDEFFIF